MFVNKIRFKIASHGRVLLCASLFSFAHAVPTGGVVVNGIADINSAGSVTTITQQSDKASINWQGFSISPNEVVNFNQPNQNSLTLNRVVGNEKSIIEGLLNANGKVFLINSNGILFSQSSSVNTAGLVASTLNLSDEDFNANNFIFEADKNSKNSVINLGTLKSTDRGYISLLGESVINDGVIIADKGTVSLNSGDKITLNFNGNSLINISIDEGTLNSLVESSNAIISDGGIVILTAKGADEILTSQVNIKGIVKAQSIDDLKGNININSYGGDTKIDAGIDASGGGFVETSGGTVTISDGTVVNTKSKDGKSGSWLIDPKDFTVGVDISGLALSANLETTNVEIQSQHGSVEGNGDININERVEWSADTVLTLSAERDININNAISANGENAGVTLNYGGDYHILTPASFSGAVLDENGKPIAKTDTSNGQYGSISFNNINNKHGLIINGQTYTLIHSMDELDGLDSVNAADGYDNSGNARKVMGYYALAHNIRVDDTVVYKDAVVKVFKGTFAGLGHTIDGLKIEVPHIVYSNRAGWIATSISVGLFGTTESDSLIRDIGIINADVDVYENRDVGILVGTNGADIYNAYTAGKITGGTNIGGLVGNVGSAQQVTISNSFSNALMYITSLGDSGGLVGISNSPLSISNSHFSGEIIADTSPTNVGIYRGDNIGGLVGIGRGYLKISDSYAIGDITGHGNVGGLAGSWNGEITNSFATGTINGGGGGLIGTANGGTIKNVYATGDVLNGGGGLIGTINSGTVNIQDAFATGNVYSTGSAGGLIGIINTGVNAVIDRVYATGDVVNTGVSSGIPIYVGGLIGVTYSGGVTITNAHATGDVSGGTVTGGFIGQGMGYISDSWASGSVNGGGNTGGFVGNLIQGGFIESSYASGSVTGDSAGGFAGFINIGSISDSYSTGDVNGRVAGGFVGWVATASIDNSYATGAISGTETVGGFVGKLRGASSDTFTVTDSFYSPNTPSQDDDNGVGVEGEDTQTTNTPPSIDLTQYIAATKEKANVISTSFQRENSYAQINKNDIYEYGSVVPASIMSNVIISNEYSSDIGGMDIEGTTYDVNSK